MKYILRALIIVSVLFLSPLQSHAIGVSPGTVTIDDLLAGQQTTVPIAFSPDENTQPQRLDIAIESNVAEYLSIPNDPIIVQPDERFAVLPLTINAAALSAGTYTAAVTGSFSPVNPQKPDSESTGGGAVTTVATAAQAKVTFTVTNEARQEYKIQQIIMRSTEEQQLLGLTLEIENTGNVATYPEKVTIAIVNSNDPSFTYEETIDTTGMSPVKPFSTGERTLITKAQLRTGLYKVNFAVYDDQNALIFERKDYSLQIFPPGTLAQKGELISFSSDKEQYKQNEIIVFNAQFKNTGEVGIMAALNVDISQKGERKDLITAKEVFVPPGKTADFSATTRLENSGTYSAKAIVPFGIYKSNEQEVRIVIEGLPILLIVGVLIGITVIGALVFILFKRRRRTPTAQQSPQNS